MFPFTNIYIKWCVCVYVCVCVCACVDTAWFVGYWYMVTEHLYGYRTFTEHFFMFFNVFILYISLCTTVYTQHSLYSTQTEYLSLWIKVVSLVVNSALLHILTLARNSIMAVARIWNGWFKRQQPHEGPSLFVTTFIKRRRRWFTILKFNFTTASIGLTKWLDYTIVASAVFHWKKSVIWLFSVRLVDPQLIDYTATLTLSKLYQL